MSYAHYSATKSAFCDFQHIPIRPCISNETIPLKAFVEGLLTFSLSGAGNGN